MSAKVWVRRPNSSPTRIQIPSSISTSGSTPIVSPNPLRDTPRSVDVELNEDFLVDDLREIILTKYPHSLGKYHDAADLAIRLPFRRQDQDEVVVDLDAGRILSPEESVIKILKEEYPSGQKVSEAWTIIANGGRDNYTRWWLQTGGLSADFAPLRGGLSPNQFIPSTGGSYGPEGAYQQEYFPYVPQTVGTPPGEHPARLRASGSSMLSVNQYVRPQGRPPLRSSRTSAQDQLFQPLRRYDNTSASSMVVETASGQESESPHQDHNSPEPALSNNSNSNRYPSSMRPNSSASGQNTPPAEYANRMRLYIQGSKQTLSTASIPGVSQSLPTIHSKPQSPLGPPPNHGQPRLSQGTSARSAIPNSTPTISTERPAILGTASPRSPGGSGPSTNGGELTVVSPVTRRRSNTLTSQTLPPTIQPQSSSPAGDRVDSPHLARVLPLVKPKPEIEATVAPPKSSAIGVIPPINVLIVEDNIINAQILEVFFRKRKLKYATAINGKEAVEKWRQGRWHLVLMDIQLPVMSGIEATKEIRRLERVNHIGVFSDQNDKPAPEDALGDLPFPSPVIIVALTASSRESDRNEALAAGCNDFLTKPVGAPWLERKAIEWGCMQALIWTSFERKKRRLELDNEREKANDGVSSIANEEGKEASPRGTANETAGEGKSLVTEGDSEHMKDNLDSVSSMEKLEDQGT